MLVYANEFTFFTISKECSFGALIRSLDNFPLYQDALANTELSYLYPLILKSILCHLSAS